MRTLTQKNFGLEESEFLALADALKRCDESLLEKVFLGHFGRCIKFLQKKYGAAYDDAYDATMETTLEFRLRILDNKVRYGNLNFLFTKMASQIYLRNTKKTSIRDITESDFEIDNKIDDEDLLVLKKSWNKLGEECKALLSLNFFSGMKLNAIALQKGKSAAAIRKQKERCLSKLEKIFVNNQ